MLIKTLKLSLVLLFGATVLFYGLPKTSVHANSGGPPSRSTGAPGDLQTCAAGGCHNSFALNSGPGMVALSGLPDNYTPGQDYTVTFTITQANRSAWGFQIVVIDDQGRQAGTLTATDTRTSIVNGTVNNTLRRYLQHNTLGTNQSSWSFRWTAPNPAVGRVTMYAAGNAANDSGDALGDYIYTTNKAMQPPSAVATVTTVSAASYNPNFTVASNSIAALFGTNLAASTVTGTTNPPATSLGGVSVRLRDSAGANHDAGLFFVSAQQINLLIPNNVANGQATLTVIRDGNTIGQGNVSVDSIATGLFSANAQGNGVAAAEVLRIKPGNVLIYEPVARFNTAGQVEAVPINFGPAEDQLFLILYGTAFRANSGGSTATIGGEAAEVLYAGTQNGLAGLDQANVRLARSLAGRGSVNVALTVGGKTANTVTVTFQ